MRQDDHRHYPMEYDSLLRPAYTVVRDFLGRNKKRLLIGTLIGAVALTGGLTAKHYLIDEPARKRRESTAFYQSLSEPYRSLLSAVENERDFNLDEQEMRDLFGLLNEEYCAFKTFKYPNGAPRQ